MYLIPSVGILGIFLFAHTDRFNCRLISSTFLLNNTYPVKFQIADLYRQRIYYGEGRSGDGELAWNFGGPNYTDVIPNGETAEHFENYWSLESTEDFINHFNFVGFNDICNYPTISELHDFSSPSGATMRKKGFRYLYPGFNDRNQTAKSLFDILAMSSADGRFSEWLKCLEIIFHTQTTRLNAVFCNGSSFVFARIFC